MGSNCSQEEKGVVSRKKGNQIERGEGDKMSLLGKAAMGLSMARCRVTSGSCLGMLVVGVVGKVERATAARRLYSVVRSRFWTVKKE